MYESYRRIFAVVWHGIFQEVRVLCRAYSILGADQRLRQASQMEGTPLRLFQPREVAGFEDTICVSTAFTPSANLAKSTGTAVALLFFLLPLFFLRHSENIRQPGFLEHCMLEKGQTRLIRHQRILGCVSGMPQAAFAREATGAREAITQLGAEVQGLEADVSGSAKQTGSLLQSLRLVEKLQQEQHSAATETKNARDERQQLREQVKALSGAVSGSESKMSSLLQGLRVLEKWQQDQHSSGAARPEGQVSRQQIQASVIAALI